MIQYSIAKVSCKTHPVVPYTGRSGIASQRSPLASPNEAELSPLQGAQKRPCSGGIKIEVKAQLAAGSREGTLQYITFKLPVAQAVPPVPASSRFKIAWRVLLNSLKDATRQNRVH
jgi:hypothetical protein